MKIYPDWQKKLYANYTALRDSGKSKELKLNLCVGVCRSGTTALAQVFGKSGFDSYYQPCKADLRLCLASRDAINLSGLLNQSTGNKNLFIKETLGPFLAEECSIDYLEMYTNAGFLPENIHIIISFRDPIYTFLSWVAQWGHDYSRTQLLDTFIRADKSLQGFEQRVLQSNVKLTYFCVTMSHLGSRPMELLFERAIPSTRFDPDSLLDWGISNYHDSKSKVIFPHEPDFFSYPQIHGNAGKYEENIGSSAQRRRLQMYNEEFAQLETSGVFENYVTRLVNYAQVIYL